MMAAEVQSADYRARSAERRAQVAREVQVLPERLRSVLCALHESSWGDHAPVRTGLRVAEPQRDPISEAELSWLWEGQRQPAGSLTAPDGSEVQILYPGRRAGGAGPDFRDAVVLVAGERRVGDIELHVRASSFAGHGHHLDPAYDRLVLHVVFVDDGPGSVRLAGGGSVPTAAFAPWVERRQAKVESWLTRPPLWQEPCQSAARRLGEAAVDTVLRAEGLARFGARRDELARSREKEGPEQALWSALLDALAFGGDRDGFGRLSWALPPQRLRTLILGQNAAAAVERVEDRLLAVAGLAPLDRAEAPWLKALLPPVRTSGLRPANRPERRLAGAARIFVRAGGDLAAFAENSVARAATAKALVAAWCVGPAPPQREALVGASRSAELLLNAVLPFVAGDPGQDQHCRALAAALKPQQPYGKTAFLERNLVRPDGRRRARSALDQQGLLALHHAWCSQGGCGRCPLS